MKECLREYCALQCFGARDGGTQTGRRGGAGPADARAFVLGANPLMIPTINKPAQCSGYVLLPMNGSMVLEKHGKVIGKVSAVPRPKFYGLTTADGIPYQKIARLHGADCLASTVIQECVRYNDPKTRCRFCAIGASLEHGATIHTKTPGQLADVAAAAKVLDNIRHVTLTSGNTAEAGAGVEHLGLCARAIKASSGLPVQVQFEPPEDPGLFKFLKDMGVDDVGLHIESFDQAVREKVTPGKAAIPVETYFEAFERAVAIFGRNKVSTYVILGLGEDEALTLDLCGKAAALGVYPFVVPLRPLLDSFLANAAPPDPEYLHRMYLAVGGILRKNGLSSHASSAGCVRCRACSLLQFTEQDVAEQREPAPVRRRVGAPREDQAGQIEIAVAETAADLEEYYRVRHEVFVTEQGVFPDSDRDGHDSEGIAIIARVDGRVAGVVRCYHQRGGVWFGGRLAVRQEYRTNVNIGALLCRKAVSIMSGRADVRRFLATIQIQNVRFFKRMGWVTLGKPFVMNNRKHQTMEKPLEKRPA